MYSIYQIAKWFLNKDKNMSAKKLQKLCWFAYSWYIVLNYSPEEENEEIMHLFEDSIAEAWVHGPVFPKLYSDFKINNYSNVLASDNVDNEEVEKFLQEIYDVYGGLTGDELEMVSHKELPWKAARGQLQPYDACRNKISDEDILKEYLPRL
jgi:uncharacterized phage-associated protein